MKTLTAAESEYLRLRAAAFPSAAFDFVREGLSLTVRCVFAPQHASPETVPTAIGGRTLAHPPDGDEFSQERHVSGQQLCQGLRTLALSKYGDLAGIVLRHWGISATDDFGVIVYIMTARGELRTSDRDSLSHFHEVYSFDEAFPLLEEVMQTPTSRHPTSVANT